MVHLRRLAWSSALCVSLAAAVATIDAQKNGGKDAKDDESSADCAPYEAGKSEIKRRFSVEHVFRRADNYRVAFRLKRRDKAVGFATVQVQVRPGLPEGL